MKTSMRGNVWLSQARPLQRFSADPTTHLILFNTKTLSHFLNLESRNRIVHELRQPDVHACVNSSQL